MNIRDKVVFDIPFIFNERERERERGERLKCFTQTTEMRLIVYFLSNDRERTCWLVCTDHKISISPLKCAYNMNLQYLEFFQSSSGHLVFVKRNAERSFNDSRLSPLERENPPSF